MAGGLAVYATHERSTCFEMPSDSDEPGRLYLPCSFSVEGAAVKRTQQP